MKIIKDPQVREFIHYYYRENYREAYNVYQKDRTLVNRIPREKLVAFLIDISNKGMHQELADIVVYVDMIHTDEDFKETARFTQTLLHIRDEDRKYWKRFWDAMEGGKKS